MDKALLDSILVRVSDFGLKILAALAVWIIGRWLIKMMLNLMVRRMQQRKLDHTIVSYSRSTISVLLNIAMVVVLMGVLGIETTSFAAFIAGAALAIGAAWSGLLSNFAAGAFLVVLRPFKMGDFIGGGGVMGRVSEIGLFVTTIITEQNVTTFVGNAKILADNLMNFTTGSSRRADLHGTVLAKDDVQAAMAEVRARLLKIPNALAVPAPEVSIHSFNQIGCTLAIHVYTHHDHFEQVSADAVAAMRGLLESAGPNPSEALEGGESGEAGEGPEAEEEDAAEGGSEGGKESDEE